MDSSERTAVGLPSEQKVAEVVIDPYPPAPPPAPVAPPKTTKPSPRFAWVISAAAFVVIVAALYLARPLLLPVLIAILLSLLLSPIVTALKQLRIPAPLGAAMALVLVGSVLGVLALNLYTPAQRWLDMSEKDLLSLERKLAAFKRPVKALNLASDKVAGMAEVAADSKPREVVIERRSLLGLLDHTQAFAVSIATTTILLYFLLASGDLFLRKLIRVQEKLRDKVRAVEISRTIHDDIGRYFVTVTAINIGLGVLTGIAMSWLGLPNPVLWGVVVAVFNFIPYIGPLASLIVLSLAAAITFDSWQQIAAIPAAFAAIAFVEGQVVQPYVIGHRLAMNPVVIFLSVVFAGWIWGIGGVFVAVPLLVVIKICADHIPGWKAISEFISST